MKRSSGFTLLEILIVLTLLSFLTINVAIAVRNGFKARAKIQEQVKDMSQVRDSLRVIERDFNQAFHYRDLEEEFRSEVRKQSMTPAQKAQADQYAAQFPGQQPPSTDPKEEDRKRNRKDPTTHFVGHAGTVDFATLNAGRMASDQKQADFIKVGYSIKSCRDFTNDQSTQCLVRRESPLVEGDITKGGIEVVLLRDVTEFKLRYYGKGKQEWNSDWDSIQGDAITKNAYPMAIEISLTVERGEKDKKKKISMQTVAAVRFTNNGEQKGGVTELPK